MELKNRHSVRSSKKIGETLVDAARSTVGRAILGGEFELGQRLSISALATQHSVSLSVMREALTRLVADGLATSTSMQGFRVVQATLQDLNDTTELSKLLLSAAIRDSIKRGDEAWEARLHAAQELQERALALSPKNTSRSEKADIAHLELLRALTSACANARLLALLESVFSANHIYHRLTVGLFTDVSEKRVSEGEEIVKAAIAREPDRVIRLLNEQIKIASEACRQFLIQQEKLRGKPEKAKNPSKNTTRKSK